MRTRTPSPPVVPPPGPDPAAHRLDQLTAHEQADAGSRRLPGRMRRAVEQLEEPLRRFVRDAHPLVEHAQAELSAGLLDDDPHLGPGRAVLGGVAEQVLDNLLDVHLLAEDQPQPRPGAPRRTCGRASARTSSATRRRTTCPISNGSSVTSSRPDSVRLRTSRSSASRRSRSASPSMSSIIWRRATGSMVLWRWRRTWLIP